MLDIPSPQEQYDRALRLQRQRMNPVNGILSSELEIVSEPHRRKQRMAHLAEVQRASRQRHLEEQATRMKAQWERAAMAAAATTAEHMITIDDLKIKRRIPFREIVIAVSKFYNVEILAILSPRREARIVRPRMIICYLAKTLTALSYPAIGGHLAGRDHTTIMHSCRKIEARMTTDRELADEIEYVRAGLTNA